MQVDGFKVLTSASSLTVLFLHQCRLSLHALGGNETDQGRALLTHNLAVKGNRVAPPQPPW